MISDRTQIRRSSGLLAAVILVAATCLLAGAEGKGSPQTAPAKKKSKSASTPGAKPAAHPSSTTKKSSASSHSHTKSTTHSAKGKKRYPKTSRQRLALLHLDSQRVMEIQQALIREGALNGEPTGTWDDATRNAMRQYQATNGYAETGLPDAKSLMKLGLGPHPLPEDIQPTAAAQSRVDPSTRPTPQ